MLILETFYLVIMNKHHQCVKPTIQGRHALRSSNMIIDLLKFSKSGFILSSLTLRNRGHWGLMDIIPSICKASTIRRMESIKKLRILLNKDSRQYSVTFLR